MSQPDEPLLQQLLTSAPARSWVERLTASFFNRDAKKAILDDVRAVLPTLVPNLEEETLRRLAGRLVQELCCQASRDARPPAAATPPLVAHDLEDEVSGVFDLLKAYYRLDPREWFPRGPHVGLPGE